MKEIVPDESLYIVLAGAVRFALGRKTYPKILTDWIMSNVPELPMKYAKTMMDDICTYKRNCFLGSDSVIETWAKFYDWLEERVKNETDRRGCAACGIRHGSQRTAGGGSEND